MFKTPKKVLEKSGPKFAWLAISRSAKVMRRGAFAGLVCGGTPRSMRFVRSLRYSFESSVF
jgi:hypothetical protein